MSLQNCVDSFETELLQNMVEKEYNNKYCNKDKSISENQNEEKESYNKNMSIKKIEKGQMKKENKEAMYFKVVFDPKTKKRKFTRILDEDMEKF